MHCLHDSVNASRKERLNGIPVKDMAIFYYSAGLIKSIKTSFVWG